MVERMLEGVALRFDTDYLADREAWNALADRVIYTGPIDAYFGYRLGALAYRSVRFETEVLDLADYQGNAVVNYTDAETPYTRIIEHKHFEFGNQAKTVISREYSAEWTKGDEPYYPVNDAANTALYERYRELAAGEEKVVFGGRLGEYRYYDMDKVCLLYTSPPRRSRAAGEGVVFRLFHYPAQLGALSSCFAGSPLFCPPIPQNPPPSPPCRSFFGRAPRCLHAFSNGSGASLRLPFKAAHLSSFFQYATMSASAGPYSPNL